MKNRTTHAVTIEELEAATERVARAVEVEAPDPVVACELCCRLLYRVVSQCIGQPAVTTRLDADRWFTTREAAAAIGVSHRYLNGLLRDGVIPSSVIGRAGKHRRVKGADIIRFLDERRSQGGQNMEVTDEEVY